MVADDVHAVRRSAPGWSVSKNVTRRSRRRLLQLPAPRAVGARAVGAMYLVVVPAQVAHQHVVVVFVSPLTRLVGLEDEGIN